MARCHVSSRRACSLPTEVMRSWRSAVSAAGPTGTVRRYLRAVSSGTFSNAQFVVLAVRNDTTVAF